MFSGILVYKQSFPLVDGTETELQVVRFVEGYIEDGQFNFKVGTYDSGNHYNFTTRGCDWLSRPVSDCQFFEVDLSDAKESKRKLKEIKERLTKRGQQ